MLIFYHNRSFTSFIILLAKKRIVNILRFRNKTNSQELDLRKIRNFANVRKVTNRQELTPWPLPSRTQSLKAAIVFDRDVTVKASSKNALNLQNLIKTVKFLISTLFF
jgi:hypothetical protein